MIRLIQAEFDLRVQISDIVDDLMTDDSTKPLSAAQGKALMDRFSTLGASEDGTVANAEKFGGFSVSHFVSVDQVGQIISDNMTEMSADEVETMWEEIKNSSGE